MQSNIIVFFFVSALLAMSFTLSYISYSYHQQMKQTIKGALDLMLSDIKREHLGLDLHHEELALFSDAIKTSSFGKLFDDLKMEKITQLPVEEDHRIGSYVQLVDNEYLYLSCSDALLNSKVISFSIKTAGVFFLVFIVLVSVFFIYIKQQFRSLHCLIEFCKIYPKDRSVYPQCDGTYEVMSLRNAIASLIKTNDNLCDQRQELFKEAAHELKSPIAVLKARLSLFEKDKTMDKSEFVKKSQEDIAYITSKLKELLFLKSIEWDMQLPKEDVNMEDNCKMMQDAFEPILRKKRVQVESNWAESFVICTYKEAMQKVLQAVFENIFIHTKEESTIVVEAKPNEIFIKNEIGGKDDIPLFSSYIGMKMIERLSDKLAYEYKTSSDEKYFYTRLVFYSIEDENCTIR
jgi:hypothetical protein